PRSCYHVNTRGAVHYRVKQYDKAIARLNESVQRRGEGGIAEDWLFLAMAHHRLGDAEEAKKCLDKAVALIEAPPEKPKDGAAPTPLLWYLKLEREALRREAEALLG